MTDILWNSLTRCSRRALQKLRRRPLEADERGRVNTVGEVCPDRSDGRAIADAESHRVHGVVEILKVILVKTK